MIRKGKLLRSVVIVAIAVFVVQSLPDIARYLKMRSV
jgi:hypothetical protein